MGSPEPHLELDTSLSLGEIGGGGADYTFVMDSSHRAMASGIRDLLVFESLGGGPRLPKFMISLEDDINVARKMHTTYAGDPGEEEFTTYQAPTATGESESVYYVDPDSPDAGTAYGIYPLPPAGLYKALWAGDSDSSMDISKGEYPEYTHYEQASKYMMLAPVGLPRTVTNVSGDNILPASITIGEEIFELNVYHVGFFDIHDRFRYASESTYFGYMSPSHAETGLGEANPYKEIPSYTGEYEYRSVVSDTTEHIAGSWPTFRSFYFGEYPYAAEYDEEIDYAVSTGGDVTAVREALYYSKKFVRTRWWSALVGFSCQAVAPDSDSGNEGDDGPQDGTDTDEDTSDDPAPFYHGHITSFGGIFANDYYGPLRDSGQVMGPQDTTHFSVPMGVGEYYNILGIGQSDAFVVGWYPQIVGSGMMPEEDSYSFQYGHSYAGSSTIQSKAIGALRTRFETTAKSLARANEYINFYTAYLESKIVEETLPREFKTKMQASRPIRTQDLSAIVGTVGYTENPGSSPTTSTSGGETPTTSMGETY